jgi:5-deoxy-glucuronate isomerase
VTLKRLDIDISGAHSFTLAKRFASDTGMPAQKLLYRSVRVAAGRTAAAIDLTPRELGWTRIHFGVRHLKAGAVWSGRSRGQERCLVLLRGELEVNWGAGAERVGPRADVFLEYPHAVYLPADTPFTIVASTASEIADCRASSTLRAGSRGSAGAVLPRVVRPGDCGFEIRGGGNATRQIVDIVPPAFAAHRLLICEVYTPSGNWSSYPPHKHDTDDPPREVDLEEIYYFRYKDLNGYGFQRVYNSRRDQTVRVAHGDVVAVRSGYHPFVTAYGYDAYYLNVLAGTRRSMAASDDPDYAQFRRNWPLPDPRVPLVPPPGGAERTRFGVA